MEYIGYIYEGNFDKHSTEETDKLIWESVTKYCETRGLEVPTGDIVRTEKGKPYIADSDVHFNVSHSGEMCIVLVGDAPCGVDIQTMEVRNHKAIAKKYYTENEQAFVDKYGLGGFFRVWVHREAFGKLTGEGIFADMPDFITEDGYPKIEVIVPGADGTPVYIQDIPIAQDIYFAFATYGEFDTITFCM